MLSVRVTTTTQRLQKTSIRLDKNVIIRFLFPFQHRSLIGWYGKMATLLRGSPPELRPTVSPAPPCSAVAPPPAPPSPAGCCHRAPAAPAAPSSDRHTGGRHESLINPSLIQTCYTINSLVLNIYIYIYIFIHNYFLVFQIKKWMIKYDRYLFCQYWLEKVRKN